MKLVFMGTSIFAVPTLQKIIDSLHTVAAVVTQPDRPSGRGGKVSFSPVKELALEYNLPIYQPDRIKEPGAVEQIEGVEPEIIVVVSYGQIIPASLLHYPQHGCINVHASLLPHYRGAAPIQRALMSGEKETGVTIMYMDEGLDTGDIIMQIQTEISPNMDHGELEAILAEKGADLLIETIALMENGNVKRFPQDNAAATYAQRLTREDEIIDWNQPAWTIHNQLRALSPAPGGYTIIDGIKVKLFNSEVIDKKDKSSVGEVIKADNEGLWIQTGNGVLGVREVQKAGKRRMPVSEFLKGNNFKIGSLLV